MVKVQDIELNGSIPLLHGGGEVSNRKHYATGSYRLHLG